MKTHSIIYVLILSTIQVFAHSGKETHTAIWATDQFLFVNIDLPWTVNESARAFYNLKEGEQVSDQETDDYIKSYILDNFEMKVIGHAARPISIRNIPQDHGHSLLYEIKYDPVQLENVAIQNLLLFNLNKSVQKNYIKLLTASGSTKYISTLYQSEISFSHNNELLRTKKNGFFKSAAVYVIAFCAFLFLQLKREYIQRISFIR